MWHVGNIDTGFWWGSLKERDYLEYIGLDGRIILKYKMRRLGMNSSESGMGQVEAYVLIGAIPMCFT